MSRVGSYLFIFGLLAIVMNYIGRTPNLLAWIYNWGETTAWAIKIALIIIGVILFFLGGKNEKQTKE